MWKAPVRSDHPEDLVLAMTGVGKDLWADEDGDTFIRRLRLEEDRQKAVEAGTTTEPRP
jgi:hypothetical protein